MGYTTKFTGQFDLSRKLTMSEAKELLQIAEMDRTEARRITGVDAYLQWVPTESLDGIVWNGEEKFYEFGPLLRWLCDWMNLKGIGVNGRVLWSGESAGDTGELYVEHNVVTEISGRRTETKSGKPLTLQRLGEMALELVAGQ